MKTITVDFALPELNAEQQAQLDRLATLEAAERRRGVVGADTATSAEEDAEAAPRWRREILATLPAVQVLRFVVRKCNYLDRAHFYALWQEGREWYQAATGVTTDEAPPHTSAAHLRAFVYRRAEILAALERRGDGGGTTAYVCERTMIPYADYLAYMEGEDVPLVGEGAVWEESYLPPEWTSLGETDPAGAGGMAENVPVELLDLLEEATQTLNRGVLQTVPGFFAQTRQPWIVRKNG